MGRGRKRKEVRTRAPTHPRQSSQAAVIAVTHTAPATHTPGAAAPFISLVTQKLPFSQGGACCAAQRPTARRISEKSLLSPDNLSGLEVRASLPVHGASPRASVPSSTAQSVSCLFSPILHPTQFPGGGRS